jgi:hypothetical protein
MLYTFIYGDSVLKLADFINNILINIYIYVLLQRTEPSKQIVTDREGRIGPAYTLRTAFNSHPLFKRHQRRITSNKTKRKYKTDIKTLT